MVGAQGSAIRVGTHGPVVNNDGVHGVVEKTGVVYLPAGLQPIRVEWFNAVARAALDVEYSGPETPRQRIPATALWREQADGDGNRRRINGLHYRIVPVVDEALPDFARVTSYQTGVCADFDPALIAGAEHQGVQFTGLLEVPRAGVYTFHLRSDDGSRLFVGRPTLQLDILGNGELPAPVPLVIGQSLRTNEHRLWATVEGTVLFAAPAGAGLRLELGAGLARLRVEIAEADGLSAADLLHRKMRLTGFCQAAQTLDGQHTPGVLLTPGRAQMELLAEPDEPAITATAGSNALPVLRTAAQVHRLKREEAQRG
jgi:hypothetical protein